MLISFLILVAILNQYVVEVWKIRLFGAQFYPWSAHFSEVEANPIKMRSSNFELLKIRAVGSQKVALKLLRINSFCDFSIFFMVLFWSIFYSSSILDGSIKIRVALSILSLSLSRLGPENLCGDYYVKNNKLI